jgi:hypothetical protein
MLFFSEPSGQITYSSSSDRFRVKRAEQLIGAEAMHLIFSIQEDDVRLSFLLLAIPLLVLLSYSLEV